MPFDDSADPLAGILIAGGIQPYQKRIADLDRDIQQARRLYDFRIAAKLDKYQSVALDKLISQDREKLLRHLETGDWSISDFLYGVALNDDSIKGRIEAPITKLLLDLSETYFRLKRFRQLGKGGPHYHFTKACMGYLGLADEMPNADALRKTLTKALERRN